MKYIYLVCIVFLFSCNNENKLSLALEYAENNKPELIKVLNYYSQNEKDSLKLKAAKFLIENMPKHYYFDDSITKGYYSFIENEYSYLPLHYKHMLYCLPEYYIPYSSNMKEDIKTIKHEFLIKRIDNAFNLWNRLPWKNDITFNTFCEYLLPYRVGMEPLDFLVNIEDSIYNRYNNLYNKYSNISILSASFNFDNSFLFPYIDKKLYLPYPINSDKYKSCISDSYEKLIKLKLLGIPACIDFTPHWADINGRHYWNSIIDYAYEKRIGESASKYSKIYRKTYSHNSYFHNDKINNVPSLFNTPFNKDVTNKYTTVVDVEIDFDICSKNTSHVYLCVFNNLSWQPVAQGIINSKNNVVFSDITVGNIYQPFFLEKNKINYIDYPFLLTSSGEMVKFIPDKNKRINLFLERKYRQNAVQFVWNNSLNGIILYAYNNCLFKDSIFIIDNLEFSPFFKYKFNEEKKYRYWEFVIPDGMAAQLAEVIFYGKDGKQVSMNNVIISSNAQCNEWYSVITDQNALSYFPFYSNVVLDFRKSIDISGVDCIARNDDNYITPGDIYELFYMDKNGWVSLGKKIAINRYLEYKNIPSNAVYWLRNLVKGNEERIFIYNNGYIEFY